MIWKKGIPSFVLPNTRTTSGCPRMDTLHKSHFSHVIPPPHIIKCFLLKIQGFSTFHISVNKPQL